MAALLESLLSRKVDLCKVLDWLKNVQQDSDRLAFSDPELTIHKQEFIPFLLNYLRDQSSQALTHGPATPAKTPTRPRPAASSQGFTEKRACRTVGGGSRGASRVQLFSPTASPGSELGLSHVSSPSFSTTWSPACRPSGSDRRPSQRISLGDYVLSSPEVTKSRRRSGNGAGKHVGGGRAAHHVDDNGSRTSRGAAFGGPNEQVSPPSLGQLNFNNLEDFPPVGSSSVSPAGSKPSRRINPTPVSAERSHSKPKTCFTSTPFAKAPSPSSPPTGVAVEKPNRSVTAVSPHGLMEERELLKREKSKRAQQTCSPPPASAEPCTSTKCVVRVVGSKVTPDQQTPCPEPSKVTAASDLDVLAELYCACISENLVPNIFLELFFVIQLLTSRSPNTSDNNDENEEEEGSVCVLNSDVLERRYLRQVHNCVYFAVKVLENQYQLLAHLDKCTLRLLAENERVASFSPRLRDRLSQAQDRSTARLSPCVSTFIHSVPFQPATDNRFNFISDKAFHTFKKQRDIFYEVLREWEDFHKEPGWIFDIALGCRIRGMMSQLTAAGSHSHFARLFLKQLVQMCKGPRVNGSSGDTPDADLLGMLGADGLGRLKRLEERLIQPHGVGGPCPPPSFPGQQEFFRDFLQAASCCQLSQHLQDNLCRQLLQLDEVSILSPPAPVGEQGEEAEEEGGDGDMEQQDEKQRFASVLLLARLLAKFLGFISFLPYQTAEKPSREIQEAAVALRSKSVPVLDVCGVLRNSMRRRRTILTVPWLVEFLSMLDFTGPLLLGYRAVLGTLCLLYRKMILSRCEETSYLNKLLMVSVLGWLFQIPVIPEDVFFTSDFTEVAELEETNANAAGLDSIPLVDQQLLYTCCPFLGEFRKLLAAFVSGSSAKGGGVVRKITPTSAEPRDAPGGGERSQLKLQADLEQAFFHNQPPSLRRTVEFVAERVGSNAVKHMKSTLVSELVERGEKMLREGLESSPKANPSKLNESICAQLCEAGLDSLNRATRFCCEKSPEAIRILLPDETSPAVLATSENITIHLATEKACSWLSANITALIRREWKCRYERAIKTLTADSSDELGPPLTPKRKPGGARVTSCPPYCTHNASLPSDVLIAIKDLLSVAAGPRMDEELPSGSQLQTLFWRVGDTLVCKKFLTAVSEQMLLNSTVLLACKLVSAELPLAPRSGGDESEPCVRALLEQLGELWERDNCCCAPLHLLFTPLAVTAVLKAGDGEWNNYLYVVRRLIDRGLLSEEELVSHWTKLAKQTVPPELMEKFEHDNVSSSLPSQMDLLQLSKRTLEGAT
ncbi:codanin-1 isoform X1 [Phyllopteryx taeniolatus]|uniref:codanin-1 isoform X1 n=1 Tax=Phyllopteryx taeniolatus TaxID=161469 RepID=UPI002AD35847|nr:codanin-1 isoform X1 [Phyllopteryx taeniolatus]